MDQDVNTRSGAVFGVPSERLHPFLKELTVGVGNNELLDEETSEAPPSRGKSRKNSRKRSAGSVAVRGDVEVPVDSEGGVGVSGRGGAPKDRRASRERSLQRLLAGMRAMNSGDFSIRLTPNGDPLMAEIRDAFNQLADKR